MTPRAKLTTLTAAIAFSAVAGFAMLPPPRDAAAQVLPGAFVTSQPTNPTGTASATKVMMGLGVAGAGGGFVITPTRSGFLEVQISGSIGNGTTADGVTWELDFAPVAAAAAPANGAAAPSGTVQCTKPVTFTALTGNLATPFSVTCEVQVTPGQAYWFDLGLLAVTGGTASTTVLTGFLKEL